MMASFARAISLQDLILPVVETATVGKYPLLLLSLCWMSAREWRYNYMASSCSGLFLGFIIHFDEHRYLSLCVYCDGFLL